ncbi:MAG: HU family DNA-binding protein [Myxococcota bacterium]
MAKKTAAKKTPKKAAPKAAPAPKPTKITGAAKVRSKSEMYGVIAEHNGLSRKQVAGVFETMAQIIGADLGKSIPVNVPGLLKITVRRKPATKATVKDNPFKPGEKMTVKAKPARNIVRIRPLKGLKDLV